MIMAGIVDRVRYPDEEVGWFDDRIPYGDVLEGLALALQNATDKRDFEETLAELERRWAERQKRALRAAAKSAAS
jgi:hypothetical protein